MRDTGIEMLVGIIFAILLALPIFAIGYGVGRDNGNKQVASGQVTCVLKENRDQTTDWVCSTAIAQQTHK